MKTARNGCQGFAIKTLRAQEIETANPLVAEAYIPLIIVSMFNQEVCLLLDTGSNKNILDGRVYQCLDERPGNSPSESLIGLSGGSGGRVVDIPFLFEQTSYCEPFLCVESIEGFDAVREETGVQIHGILGNRFFLEHNWVLDFDKMAVSF